jgi:hypothetical protein
MDAVNQILARILDVLMRPAGAMPPLASLAVVSVATAIAMLLVARVVSNSAAIRNAKGAILADLFEVRLFNDDLGAIFRALGLMLAHALRYLRLSLVPALWLAAPIALLTIQLDPFYGYSGIAPGQTTLLTALVTSPTGHVPAAVLRGNPGVRVDSPAIWFPSTGELVWRVTGVAPGASELELTVDGETVQKTVQVSTAVSRRSSIRVGGGDRLKALLNPSERVLPPGNVRQVSIGYPDATIRVWKLGFSWLTWYLVFTLTAALTLRRRLHVEI